MQRLLPGRHRPADLDVRGPWLRAWHVNLPAILIVLLIMVLLVRGVRESARANAIMVAIKLAAVLFFIAVGARYVHTDNWCRSQPYGWSGVMSAAAVVFFAYIGFDAVSTTAEAKNPQRDLPIGIIASLVVCTASTWPWPRC